MYAAVAMSEHPAHGQSKLTQISNNQRGERRIVTNSYKARHPKRIGRSVTRAVITDKSKPGWLCLRASKNADAVGSGA